jgi:cysteinyl-tRNA synthetase
MSTRFYNTINRKKVEFEPITPGTVKLYTCGPTVYDTAHIGNFRTFIFEDLLKRFLVFKGYEVYHVMNITDVDDKTIKRAITEEITINELTLKYTEEFMNDIKSLKILPADKYPRATDHIDEMIKMIQALEENGYAYETEDHSVYFRLDAYDSYGQLTQIDLTQQRVNERIINDEYSKDNPQDFALWKARDDDDGKIYWESPWGRGRPGWHIECSAMSIKYLGNHFDIHCGGVDNIFPHHENEIAQSVSATQEPFVNYWMHSEYLQIHGDKMSKTLGNYYKISDLISEGFTAEEIRFTLLNAHYRSKLDFSLKQKQEARTTIQRITDFQQRLLELKDSSETESSIPDEFEEFVAALDDDLDTPKAFAIFFGWIRSMNKLLDRGEFKFSQINGGLDFIDKFDDLFAIIPDAESIPQNIYDLIKKREKARLKQDWKTADKIRNQLYQEGWLVADSPSGPKVRSKK